MAKHPRDALWQQYRLKPMPGATYIDRMNFDLLVDDLEAKHAKEVTALTERIAKLERDLKRK